MNRKTILVDLDNVVYDWIHAVSVWLLSNGAVDYDSTQEMNADYTAWKVWESWGLSQGEFFRWWRLGIEAEVIYAQGRLIAGARDALWILSDMEWDIHIATSRLTKFGLHAQIARNTINWLHDANIPYRQLSLVEDKTVIRADAIVDDRADNMLLGIHKKVFLFPANHNIGGVVTEDQQLEAWVNIIEKLGSGYVQG